MPLCINVSMYARIYVPMYPLSLYVSMYLCMYLCTYACTYACMYVYTNVCIFNFMYVLICSCNPFSYVVLAFTSVQDLGLRVCGLGLKFA